jgi:hypothetical protein
MDIELHIEELVLHGFASGDHHRVAAAVRLELTRLLATQGATSLAADPRALKGLNVERLNAGSISITPGSRPQSTGRAIARAIYHGLQPAATSPRGIDAGAGVRRP